MTDNLVRRLRDDLAARLADRYMANTAAAAADRIEALEKALRKAKRGYVHLMTVGHDRILDLSGTCDPVDVMERADPTLRAIDAALGAE